MHLTIIMKWVELFSNFAPLNLRNDYFSFEKKTIEYTVDINKCVIKIYNKLSIMNCFSSL